MKRKGQATIIECIVSLAIVIASFTFLYQAQNYVTIVGHRRPDTSFAYKVLYQMDNPRLSQALAYGKLDPFISTLKAEIEHPMQIEIIDEKGNILFSYSDPELMKDYAEEISYSYFFMNRTFTVRLRIS